MLDVRRLHLLRELSHRGTIAAVAEALAYTPSAVSQQLSVLEKEAGVPLLERTGRRVALTAAGRVLVGHAEAVLERLETAAADLAHSVDEPGGPLHIGTVPSVTRALLPEALPRLGRALPDLRPVLCETDPAQVPDALRSGRLDVALLQHYGAEPPPPPPGLNTVPLCTERMYLASPAAWKPPPGGRHAVRSWREAPWITASPGTLCHTAAVEHCAAEGFAPDTVHHVDDFGAVLELVATGLGVAFVPELGAQAPPEGVVLAQVEHPRCTEVAFRRGAGGHPAVTAFTHALMAAVPAGMRG
ncbi:LysR family transcriptional regulator [Streptomyces sp. TR06-5]|uniref:LysR family transcriptional regulator n=1 Tax=unclassified Streptomyces TaxID=2593676 RepID=UPI0039A048AA